MSSYANITKCIDTISPFLAYFDVHLNFFKAPHQMKYSRNPIKVSKSTGVAQFYYMLTTYCEGFFARDLDSILFATQLSGVPKESKWDLST